jgi:hypothetical protein
MAVTLVIGGSIFYLSFIVAQKVDFERVRLEGANQCVSILFGNREGSS